MIGQLILAAVRQAGRMSAAGGEAVAGSASQQKQLYDTNTGKLLKTNMKKVNNFTEGFGKFAKQMVSKPMGMAGINLSVSSLLRQSQIFTGVMGALFQILGGFIDVLLAPFMPILSKVIQMLAGQIPRIRDLAQRGFDWLAQNVFPIIEKIYAKVVEIWDNIAPDIAEAFEIITSDLTTFLKKDIIPKFDETGKELGGMWADINKSMEGIAGEIGIEMDALWGSTVSFVYKAAKWFATPYITDTLDALLAAIKIVGSYIVLLFDKIAWAVGWGFNIYRAIKDWDNYKDTFKAFLDVKWLDMKIWFKNVQKNILNLIGYLPRMRDRADTAILNLTTEKGGLFDLQHERREAQATYKGLRNQFQINEKVEIALTMNGLSMDANDDFGYAGRRMHFNMSNQNLIADASGFNETGLY